MNEELEQLKGKLSWALENYAVATALYDSRNVHENDAHIVADHRMKMIDELDDCFGYYTENNTAIEQVQKRLDYIIDQHAIVLTQNDRQTENRAILLGEHKQKIIDDIKRFLG